jgi:CubicO group peptidase (beta-lactamase class C family)
MLKAMRLFIHLALAMAFAWICRGQSAVSQNLNSHLEAWKTVNSLSGSVLLIHRNQTLWNEAYGPANREWKVANTKDTKFRIGSITKTFTAVGILLLEQEGKLSVNDPIHKHLPDAPESWRTITLHHLLSHTSGIHSLTNWAGFSMFSRLPLTTKELYERIRDWPLRFAVGEQYEYSNSGFIILGLVIEKVSGQTYREFLQDSLLKPALMANSGLDVSEEILPQRAAGYKNNGENATYLDMCIPFSAGAMYSTTGDLAKWVDALMTDKILRLEARTKLWTPVKGKYGYGWSVINRNGKRMVGHNGSINGFQSSLWWLPEQQLLSVVLCNRNGPDADRLSVELVDIAMGERVSTPRLRRFTQLNIPMMDRYIGTYRLDDLREVMITREGTELFLQVTKQPKFLLRAENDTNFYIQEVESDIELTLDQENIARSLTIRQAAQKFVCPRISSER